MVAMVTEIEALRQENAAQRAQLAALIAVNGQLALEIAKLNECIGELLAIAQRKQRKPSVPQPPAPPAALDAAAKKAFDERPKAPLRRIHTPRAAATTRA